MVAKGLFGFVSATVNGSLRLDGIALRKTLNGNMVLSFPARRDSSGCQHTLVCPINDRARRDLEFQIFQALGIEEVQSK